MHHTRSHAGTDMDVPEMVTAVPPVVGPVLGLSDEMEGGVKKNCTVDDCWPPTLICTDVDTPSHGGYTNEKEECAVMMATAGDANTDPAQVTEMAAADAPKLLPDTTIVPPAVVPVHRGQY